MPQNGFHGLVGLAVARWVAPRVPRDVAEPFVAGVTLGAMLPDIDMYPTAVVWLLGRADLVYVVHRTLTHSLFALLVAAGLGVALLQRARAAAWVCWGLAVGIATHALLDAFFWFAPLDLFWPMSHWPPDRPLLPVIDLWAAARPLPERLINLREACEFAAFALYLVALKRIVRCYEPGRGEGEALARWARWAWAGFIAAVPLALLLPNLWLEVFVYAAWLLALAPYCWWTTLRLREYIAGWSLGSEAVRGE